MLFVSFTKGPEGFPYVFIITGEVPTLIAIDGITLGDHGVFVLRGDQEVLDGAATFEVSLDTIPTTDLFDAYTKSLCVRYDYVTLTFNFSGASRGTVSTLVVNPINGLTYIQGLCKIIKKICGRYGIQTHFKGGSTIKNLLVPPRTNTPWSPKVMPSIAISVGTSPVMMNT